MAPQREWFEKDYYQVLGVAESATAKEITRAYRKLAKENHPDANPGREDRFKEISAAYDLESVPTLYLVNDGKVVASVGAWDREGFNGVAATLAELIDATPVIVSDEDDGLPEFKPG